MENRQILANNPPSLDRKIHNKKTNKPPTTAPTPNLLQSTHHYPSFQNSNRTSTSATTQYYSIPSNPTISQSHPNSLHNSNTNTSDISNSNSLDSTTSVSTSKIQKLSRHIVKKVNQIVNNNQWTTHGFNTTMPNYKKIYIPQKPNLYDENMKALKKLNIDLNPQNGQSLREKLRNNEFIKENEEANLDEKCSAIIDQLFSKQERKMSIEREEQNENEDDEMDGKPKISSALMNEFLGEMREKEQVKSKERRENKFQAFLDESYQELALYKAGLAQQKKKEPVLPTPSFEAALTFQPKEVEEKKLPPVIRNREIEGFRPNSRLTQHEESKISEFQKSVIDEVVIIPHKNVDLTLREYPSSGKKPITGIHLNGNEYAAVQDKMAKNFRDFQTYIRNIPQTDLKPESKMKIIDAVKRVMDNRNPLQILNNISYISKILEKAQKESDHYHRYTLNYLNNRLFIIMDEIAKGSYRKDNSIRQIVDLVENINSTSTGFYLIFLGRLLVKCPYLRAKFPNKHQEKSLKEHIQIVDIYIRIYCELMLRIHKSNVSYIWIMLMRILNKPICEMTPAVLLPIFLQAKTQLLDAYRWQYQRVVLLVKNEYKVKIKEFTDQMQGEDKSAAILRLTFLDSEIKKQAGNLK